MVTVPGAAADCDDGEQLLGPQALRRMLRNGPRTVPMRDVGAVEKVGRLYHAPDLCRLTRLGHLDDLSAEDLRIVLGDGTIETTFELEDQ